MARDNRARFSRGLGLGILGALGFAAWLGIPVLNALAAGPVVDNATSRIETIIIGTLVGFALFTAWRFHSQHGWNAGTMLLLALTVEVAKRIVLNFQETAPFDPIDAIFVVLIALGLLNGIRAARAIRDGALL